MNAPFCRIPIEVKLGTKINQRMLAPLKTFIEDTKARFGILINNSDRIEFLTDSIIQIPARYI